MLHHPKQTTPACLLCSSNVSHWSYCFGDQLSFAAFTCLLKDPQHHNKVLSTWLCVLGMLIKACFNRYDPIYCITSYFRLFKIWPHGEHLQNIVLDKDLLLLTLLFLVCSLLYVVNVLNGTKWGISNFCKTCQTLLMQIRGTYRIVGKFGENWNWAIWV